VQLHKHATQQGYATQSEAEPETPNPHTGQETGRNNLSRGLLYVYTAALHVSYMFHPLGRAPWQARRSRERDSTLAFVQSCSLPVQVMPMLLLMPQLMPPWHRVLMLGYGDVVVPGLLIVLLRRFDVATGSPLRSSYFLASMIAYTVGMLLTDLALEFELFGSQGQPALLYLVPSTLGTAWLLAYWRGDCMALWTGQIEDWKDHASGSDDLDIERGDGLLAGGVVAGPSSERRGAGNPLVPLGGTGGSSRSTAREAETLAEC
jgi:hypothetical protein